jgi:hypothetical protein
MGKNENITSEEIAGHYSAAMDVDHLLLVVDWSFWTDEDLTPFHDAISAGKAAIAAKAE